MTPVAVATTRVAVTVAMVETKAAVTVAMVETKAAVTVAMVETKAAAACNPAIRVTRVAAKAARVVAVSVSLFGG